MNQLSRTHYEDIVESRQSIIKDALRVFPNITRGEIEAVVERQMQQEVFMNETYQVTRLIWGEGLVWLVIKRRDGTNCRDWQDIQDIKNQLIGAECEAVELYPAESRLVDVHPQYHLFGCPDPSFRFPFGFSRRSVERNKQSPFSEDCGDCRMVDNDDCPMPNFKKSDGCGCGYFEPKDNQNTKKENNQIGS